MGFQLVLKRTEIIICKKMDRGAGEMAQDLRALAPLVEALGLISNIHMAANNLL